MAPEVPASISSDSDSSLSDEAPAIDVTTLQQAVHENPHDFSAHAALVKGIRSAGSDVHALRMAREKFADAFPLPPHMWKEWIDDERRIASSLQEKINLLQTLFPKALGDYMSVELHIMRLELAIQMCRAGEVEREVVKNVFFDSCYAGAVAVLDSGEVLWDKYRAFMHGNDESLTESSNLQAEVLRGHVFVMENRASLKQECAVFETKLNELMADGEGVLGQASEKVVMQFRSYAEYAKTVSDIFAIAVYERGVAVCFLNPVLWLEYIRFCQTVRKGSAYSVCHRATRNVPWAMVVWVHAILAIPEADEKRLVRSKAEEFLSVLRRVKDHVMLSNDMQGAEMLTKMTWTVFLALGHPFGILDELLTTLSFNINGTTHWAAAQCHAASILRMGGEPSRATGLMQEVVASRPHESRWWVAYAKLLHLAEGKDAEDKIRELFRRAMSGLSSRAEVDLLSDAWVEFELEINPQRACLAQWVAEIYSVVTIQRAKFPPPTGVQRAKKREAKTGKKTLAENGGNRNLPKRKRAKPGDASASGTENRRKDMMEDETKETTGENADKKLEGRENGDMEISRSSDGEQAKPETITHDKEGLKPLTAKSEGDGVRGSRGTGEVEPKTIFINNLAFNVSEVDLRQEFEFAGKINEVRMPRRSDGASKGIAYVQFEKDEYVETALSKHMKPIKGRAAWVRRSKPPPRKAKRARGSGHPRHSGRADPAMRGQVGLMQPRSIKRRMLINTQVEPDAKDRDVTMKDDGDVENGNGNKDDGNETTKPKSQDDFRTMFLSKK